MVVRVGVLILPEARWSVTRERWLAAEALGFDHAWTYDHLTWRSFRDAPWFGAVPTLAAVAEATSRIRFGTLVASPNFRHPVPFAKELMTLDDLGDGRVTLGIGAGGEGFDAEALGGPAWTPRERVDRLDEFVTLLDRLLVERETSHVGRFYTAHEARAIPGCVQRPRAMRVAARHGATWVTVDSRGADPDQVARMNEVCAEAGRDPGSLERLVLLGFRDSPLDSIEAYRDAAGRYGELGFTDLVVHWPRDDEPFRGRRDVLEQVAAERAASP